MTDEKKALNDEMLEEIAGGKNRINGYEYSDGPFVGKSGRKYMIRYNNEEPRYYDVTDIYSYLAIQKTYTHKAARGWIEKNG